MKSKQILISILLSFSQNLLSQVTFDLYTTIKLAGEKNPTIAPFKLNAALQETEITTAKLRPNILFNNQSLFLTDRNYLDKIQPNAEFFVNPFGQQIFFQVTKQYQIGNKRSSKIELQKRKYDFVLKTIDDYTYQQSYNAALKWLDVWKSVFEMDIILQAEANLDTLLEINEERFTKKLISKNELIRTQILDEQYNTLEAAARQKYRSELQRLAYMLGSRDSVAIDLTSSVFFFDIPDQYDSLVKFATKYRPDLIVWRSKINTTKSEIMANKAASIQNPEGGLLYNPQNTQPYLGWYITIPLPILDRNQGMIQKSKVFLEQNKSEYESALWKATAEIKLSLQEYQTYRDNAERYRKIEEDADQIFFRIRDEYSEGKTSIVDYLLAKQTWYETQQAYYSSLYQYRKSYIDLLYVSGYLVVAK